MWGQTMTYRDRALRNFSTCIARYFDKTVVRFQPRDEFQQTLLCKWIRRETWEASTFRVFKEFLHRGTSYIGFGAWVGPMVLYAAHQSKADAYCFEPDHAAFTALKLNIRLNNEVTRRVKAYHRCIDTTWGFRTMYTSGAGNSLASLMNVSTPVVANDTLDDQGTKRTSFSVHCVPMKWVLRWYKITPPYFFKMDCEGCEKTLLPSWHGLLQREATHTTVFVSLHQHLTGAWTSAEIATFLDVFAVFKFVFEVVEYIDASTGLPTGLPTLLRREVPQMILCEKCSYVLSNAEPRGAYTRVNFNGTA